MPKISKPLTSIEVKNYKSEVKMYKKPDGKGLWLIIMSNELLKSPVKTKKKLHSET